MTSFVSAALALAVIASFLLVGFGLNGLRTQKITPLRAWLMVGAGVVTLLNVVAVSPLLTAVK